jgi:biotin-dependent carboxylase-like uncharacterized protein
MLRALTISSPVLVQDMGRPGRAHEGIARSGVFDHGSAALANRLVGNHHTAAVLEILLGGCTFEALRTVAVAVTGADSDISVGGRAASTNTGLLLHAGDTMQIGIAHSGLRLCLAVRGGIGAASVLGSRSWDTLGQIGPPPVRTGDTIMIADDADPMHGAWFETVSPPSPSTEHNDATVTLTATRGPRHGWIDGADLAALAQRVWRVDAASDRTGVRLIGNPLIRRAGELHSEAMIPGAIQVPANGQPIILGPDCGTTGGYPVIGVVRRRDLDRVAQLRPGQRVRIVLQSNA